MVGRLHHQLRAAGLPAPVPSIETDVIALKLELMRNSGYLSYHAEAHLRGSGERFIQPLEVPGMRTLRHAGLIHRHGIELSPAANALVDILGRYSAEAKTGHLRHQLSRG
jgi:hypothetical protein